MKTHRNQLPALLAGISVLSFLSPRPLAAAPGDVDSGIAPSTPFVAGDLELGFNPGVLATALVIQPDGKMLVGGTLQRLNADGTPDASFSSDAAVSSLCLQPDGKILITGDFSYVDGVASSGFARLNADGSVDAAYTSNLGISGIPSVLCCALQLDGKAVVGGDNILARQSISGTPDAGFAAPYPYGKIKALEARPDGKIYAAGNYFFYLNGSAAHSGISRLNSDGTVDSGFNTGVGSGDSVECFAIQPDARVIIGGYITSVNGQPSSSLARLNNDGTQDAGFAPVIGGGRAGRPTVSSVVVQADGKVLFGGDFTTVNGIECYGLARVNADGSLDAGFNPYLSWLGGGGQAKAALQADGRIVIFGGFFDFVAWLPRNGPARLYNDPTTQSLVVSSSARVQWLRGGASPETNTVTFELSTNGGGSWTSLGTGTRITGGWELTGLGLPPSGQIRARARMPGGSLLETVVSYPAPAAISAAASAITSTSATLSGTVNANGKATTASFQYGTTTAYGTSVPLVLSPGNGSTDLAVSTALTGLTPGTTYHFKLTASSTDGATSSPDGSFATQPLLTTFKPDPNYSVYAAAVQPDGRILIGGQFTQVAGQARSAFARLNPDGSLDRKGFNPSTGPSLWAVAAQGDGKTILAGNFGQGISRLLPDGFYDTNAYYLSSYSQVNVVAMQADGKAVIGGSFTKVNGVTRKYLARVNADESLDSAFVPPVLTINMVKGVAVQPDGRVLVGGSAIPAGGGVEYPTIMRLNADGSTDPTFTDPGLPNTAVNCIAVQADGRILVGCSAWSTYTGAPLVLIARLNANGSLDTSFNPSSTGVGGNYTQVYSIALQADGRIIMGGSFTNVSGVTCNHIARLNADGSVDATFNPNANDTVLCLALQADGAVLAGGAFTTVGGVSRSHLARLLNDPATQSLSVTSASSVQWLRGGTSPETQSTSLELSTNGGASWTALAAGTRISGGWQFNGLSLPGSGRLRARARIVGGSYNGSSSLVEQTLSFPAADGNNALSSLALSSGTLTPAFAPSTVSYTADVSNATSSLTLTPTAAAGTSTIKVNATTVASGTASGPISLAVGPTTITVTVTAQDTTTRTYTVVVTRAAPATQTLADWRQAYFGSTANSGNGADLFDYDHDGIVNLAEFAFGLMPTANSAGKLPQPQRIGTSLVISFTQPAVTGITYGAEWNTNLTGSWTPVPDTGNGDQHLFTIPIGTATRLFTRLTVTSP